MLWILPPPAKSRWFSRIDWYLNWQLSKGLSFERMRPSLDLLRVMEESGIAFEEAPAGSHPLMVASAGMVHAEKCVVVDSPGGLKAWLKEVAGVVKGLQPERVRVFLPQGARDSEALEIWQALKDTTTAIEFTSDEVDAL